MSGNCAVCRIKTSCSLGNLYLYAPTPILFDRIRRILESRRIPFTASERTIVLEGGPERDALVARLRAELSEPEARDLRIAFDQAHPMGAASLELFGLRVDTQWFQKALEEDCFAFWFQPIVNAAGGTLLGHECLIRLARTEAGEAPWYNGQEIVNAALDRGDIHIFDGYARKTAIRQAAPLHREGKLFINFMPSSIYDPAFCMASTFAAMERTHLRPEDIVFEVVESERVSQPAHLRKIAAYYRDKGFGIALDDVGTGSNSLQMIGEIQPDYIKLDKSLVWNCFTPIGIRTIRKLAELAGESDIQVIAEGIETAEMRDALLDAGIQLMQGYYFAKPGPAFTMDFPAQACDRAA